MNDQPSGPLWNSERKEALTMAMLERVRGAGVHADNGFKKQDWAAITLLFKEKTGLSYSKQQLQSQMAILKKAYSCFKKLKDNSGFGWDSEQQLATAPQATWDAYILAHPDAAKYRTSTLPFFKELDELFSGKCATGEWAVGPSQLAPTPVTYTEGMQSPTDPASGESRSSQESSVSSMSRNRKRARSRATGEEALHILRDFTESKKCAVTAALKLFNDEIAAGMAVADRVRIKCKLAEKGIAKLYCMFDAEERAEYVAVLLQN